MAKNKNLPVVVETLEEAKVKNTINLDVNVNDLLNVIYEEKLEEYENKIEPLQKKLEEFFKGFKEIVIKQRDNFKANVIISVEPLYDKTKKILKSEGYKIEEGISLFEGNYHNIKFDMSIHNILNFEDYATTKAKLTKVIENCYYCSNESILIYESYKFTLSGSDKKGNILLSYVSKDNKINSEIIKSWKKQHDDLAKEINSIAKELFELKKEYVAYMLSKERLKSKLVKSNLNQSKEGRDIVKRIEGLVKPK